MDGGYDKIMHASRGNRTRDDEKRRTSMKNVRPNSFSDPYKDFTSAEDVLMLQSIIKKRDEDLTTDDLLWIFNGCLPAGEYGECLYFVDIVFDRISESLADGREFDSDLSENICIWIGLNWHNLCEEGKNVQMVNRYYDILNHLIEKGCYDDDVVEMIVLINGWSEEKLGDKFLETKLSDLDKSRIADMASHYMWLARVSPTTMGREAALAAMLRCDATLNASGGPHGH